MLHDLSKFCTRLRRCILVLETGRSRHEFRRIKDAMSFRNGALVALTVVAFVAGLPAFSASQRREARVGVVGVPTVLDPASGFEGTIPLIARHVFDTLVAYR